MIEKSTVTVIGGGLAGVEATWQLLRLGCRVKLYEMRSKVTTPAHKTSDLAELVCSNSFKSLDPNIASGQLKNEMTAFQSLILQAANIAKVPADKALAVDRKVFSQELMKTLSDHPNFTLLREEVKDIPSEKDLSDRNEYIVLATGPLTSESLSHSLSNLIGDEKHLAFYDAIAPIVDCDSIDMNACFWGNRHDENGADYLNIALNKEEYLSFVKNIIEAKKTPLHSFEKIKYFESCLPLEVLAERGVDTLRFGPLKPKGFTDPRTGVMAYANIQLRREDKRKAMLSFVGFQTKMTWPEQKRVFSSLPGLKNLEFFRYGSVHRNTYLPSPKLLADDFSFLTNRRVFPAGQIVGVEGYLESASIGLLVGQIIAGKINQRKFQLPPQETVLGALSHYVLKGSTGEFSPMNANWGLVPFSAPKKMKKNEKRALQSSQVQSSFTSYLKACCL